MLDAALDRLFSASRAAFVAERQRLAKELKAAGNKEEAAQVAALTKPTVAAWVVNQLARRHPELIKKLGKAGARLREVQLGRHEQTGDDRRAFSDAVAAQRDALREARVAAAALLSEEGNAAPVHLVETVLRILRGGAASDFAQATIAQGRLVREPAGGDELGLLAGQAVFGVAGTGAATKASASAATSSSPSSSAHTRGGHGKGAAAAKDAKPAASRAEEAAALRAQKAAALAAERENARRRAAEEREVEKLRAAAEKADAQRAEREEDVEAARQTLAKAEARAAAAATAAESARARLTEAERRLRAGVS